MRRDLLTAAVLLVSALAARADDPSEAFERAEALWRQGRCAEAIPAFERLIRSDPALLDAHFALGVCYSRTGQKTRAAAELAAYAKAQPESADGHAALGLVLAGLGRTADARRELERALALDPKSAEARLALARIAFRRRDYQAASDYLAPLLAGAAPVEREVYTVGARSLFNRNEKKAALSLCERGLVAYPGSAELEQLHVALLLDCRHEEACRRRLLECLARNPRSGNYVKGVAELAIESDRASESTAALVRRMVELLPSDPGAGYLHAKWMLGSNITHDRGTYRAARDEAASVLAQSGAGAVLKMQCFDTIARAEEALTRFAEAESAHRKALALNRTLAPPNPAVAMHYVAFLEKADRNGDAAKVLDEILNWAPTFGPAHLKRAKLLEEAGRRQPAIDEAKLAIECGLPEPEELRSAHYLLANLYTALGREDEASEYRRRLSPAADGTR